MKTYKMAGGYEITATSNEELVQKLNITSLFGFREDLQIFMEDTAGACKFYNGAEIRFDSIENFIEDLISNNFLLEIE